MRKVLAICILFVIAGIVLVTQIKQPQDETPLPQQPQNNQTTLEIPRQLSNGQIPTIPFHLPNGFTIHLFASGLTTPRDLVFSPGGTLLVSDPSKNLVIALPDTQKKGSADEKKVVLSGGSHVHGLAFYKQYLFVAEVDRVVRYSWDEQTLTATFDKVLFTLPGNNDHNNRTLVFDDTGTMFLTVGSTCNVCNERSNLSATVVTSNVDGDNPHVYAKGLRNAPFIVINPLTKDLWATEMGRDNLGDNIPPDEINIIKEGKDYGWPFCYGNKIHDTNFDKHLGDPCMTTEPPLHEIPAHSAPLGLAFIASPQFPKEWQNDLLVSYHGSWNRSIPTGYKVVHMKVSGNSITSVEDFLTGFGEGPNAQGRPVDLTFDAQGNLYLSDDKAGNIYIIQKAQ